MCIRDRSEESVAYSFTPYKYNGSATWPASPTQSTYHHAGFITPSNFVQVVVCNESASGYHDGLNGASFNTSEITNTYKAHLTTLKTSLGGPGTVYNGGFTICGNNNGCTVRAGDRVDGKNPSLTIVLVDPGINGEQGHDGPDVGFGFGTTASQRFWWEGVQNGEGLYGLDAITTTTTNNNPVQGYNFSLSDFQDVTAWNEKSNALELVFLNDQAANSSVPFWKGVLLDAVTKNISI